MGGTVCPSRLPIGQNGQIAADVTPVPHFVVRAREVALPSAAHAESCGPHLACAAFATDPAGYRAMRDHLAAEVNELLAKLRLRCAGGKTRRRVANAPCADLARVDNGAQGSCRGAAGQGALARRSRLH